MSIANPIVAALAQASSLPAEFLNAYEIENIGELSWDVALYKIERVDGQALTHEERGEIKNIFWRLRGKYKAQCPGLGFVIDIGRDLVAVPSKWNLPSPEEYGDYVVYRQEAHKVTAATPRHQAIITGLIREGIKLHFKNNNPEGLGALWRDYGRYCQRPQNGNKDDYSFCRRFDFAAKVLRGRRWVIELPISTTAVDGRSFADYYLAGAVADLADMIEAKRAERVDRQNRPVATRVLNTTLLEALELVDDDLIIGHARLNEAEQKKLAAGAARCFRFPNTNLEVPLYELRLILGPQNTQEDHSETIISPAERVSLMLKLRNFIDGVDIYGQTLKLSQMPFDASLLQGGFIAPPAICVKGRDNKIEIIAPPAEITEETLRERTKLRSQHIRRYGFLEHRPINPLLAYPKYVNEDAAKRMKNDLNYILGAQGINYRFEMSRYRNVEEIKKEIEQNGYDAALIVLPEPRSGDDRKVDIHEQVKQRLDVPSQCIHLRNTMPKRVNVSLNDLYEQDQRLAGRIRQRYELLILNLLVKHHWLPFFPVDASFYNVHVGWDVGGQHSTKAVSCFGYGFSRPKDGLIFRPDAIPIDIQKAEPIPPRYLYEGLLRQFEIIHREYQEIGVKADFERTLFIHDGSLLGDKENSWNEKDALFELHKELFNRGWISKDSVWTAVEGLKSAEEWRLFRGADSAVNPLAGRYVFPYDDEDVVLVCTTGAQYLTQGTSNPLMLKIFDLHGKGDRHAVVRDIVWGADMCFTKPDIGMRLPWPLYVADAGALQQAKSYKFTGITV